MSSISWQHWRMVIWMSIGLGVMLPIASTWAQSKTRPNVVLVMADDQGWGQTGYRGHARLATPNLDAMAENGLRFERFYAAAPVCSPTRASVLTGRTNRRTGVESHGYALRRQEPTLAQAMAQAGYATGHFGKWHLNGIQGPGVPVLKDDPYSPGVFGFQTWVSVTNFFDLDPILSRQGDFEEFTGDSSEIAVAEAIQFLKKNAEAETPSFCVIWFGSPHGPFRSAASDSRQFDDLDENSKNQLGELVAMDRSIGALRRAIAEAGIADNTLVWFTSDNGGLPRMTPSTTGGLRGFKASLYEGGLRVPAIMEWPGRIQPRITNFPAVSTDIVPTISEIVGLDNGFWLQPQDGLSLTRLFDSELSVRQQAIGFHFLKNSAVIDGQYKLIRLGATDRKPEELELYDLAVDPSESHNLYAKRPALAAKMKQLLDQHTDSVAASVQGADYPSGKVREDYRQPQQWTSMKEYQPYFDLWKERPEYRSRLNRPARNDGGY